MLTDADWLHLVILWETYAIGFWSHHLLIWLCTQTIYYFWTCWLLQICTNTQSVYKSPWINRQPPDCSLVLLPLVPPLASPLYRHLLLLCPLYVYIELGHSPSLPHIVPLPSSLSSLLPTPSTWPLNVGWLLVPSTLATPLLVLGFTCYARTTRISLALMLIKTNTKVNIFLARLARGCLRLRRVYSQYVESHPGTFGQS